MRSEYQDKLITMEQALALVKSGDRVCFSEGACSPAGFMGQLHTLKGGVSNLDLWLFRVNRVFPFMDMTDTDFTINEMFMTKPDRVCKARVNYVPTHLSKAGLMATAQRQPDIFVMTVAPIEDGKVSAGLSAGYNRIMVNKSKIVIAEVNKYMPYTYGDTEFDINDIDYFVEADIPLTETPEIPISEEDRVIGKMVADMIHDGDSLQVGIGGIPNALMECLFDKKDLGVHTEFFSDGLAKLCKAGVINNSKKTLHKGKTVTAIIDGTRSVFEFADHNRDILNMPCAYTNDVAVLEQNDNQISVNSTLEIDLTGQCCSESIGSRQFSGTGGQAETAIGAQRSKNGKSFMVLHSTAMVRSEDGTKKMVSKIVPQLKQGATVSLQRNDVQYVVTEYGMVNLRGMSIADRVHAMISIAHPDFRDELLQRAKEIGLID